MTKLTARSSTIFIATGDKTRVYHSMSDLSPALRRKLQESTRGVNSATILIADKGGREEIIRSLQRTNVGAQSRLPNVTHEPDPELEAATARRLPFSLRTCIELLLPVAIGAALWLFIGSRL